MKKYEDGVWLIDKPLEWTSFDVVKKVRSLLKVKKLGHAGTLDPLARGLLILCADEKTKSISTYQNLPKIYEGTIGVGKTTASYDMGTPFEEGKNPYIHLEAKKIYEAAKEFTGEIMQQPPIYSALKVKGKRAYSLARRGETPLLAPRRVHIKEFLITKIDLPYIDFRVICSRGTYIRSLAHDLGKKLQTGGYLKSLVRTHIGPYKLEDAYKIEELKKSI